MFSCGISGECFLSNPGRMAFQELGLKRCRATVASAGCPKFLSDRKWAQLSVFPPGFFIAGGVKLAMVQVAQWHCKFIADLASQSFGLCEAQMMGMDGPAPADEAREPGHIAKVAGIPKTLNFTSEQLALVYMRTLGCAGRRFFEWVDVRPGRSGGLVKRFSIRCRLRKVGYWFGKRILVGPLDRTPLERLALRSLGGQIDFETLRWKIADGSDVLRHRGCLRRAIDRSDCQRSRALAWWRRSLQLWQRIHERVPEMRQSPRRYPNLLLQPFDHQLGQ